MFTKGWEQFKLGELSEVRTGKAFSSADFNNGGEYLVITNKNIQDGTSGSTPVGDRIDISEETILNKYLLKGNNILVTMDGVNIGKTGKYSNEKAILAQRVGRINSEQIEFLYQVTKNNQFISEMKKLSVGNAIKHISLKQISDYSFGAPIDEEEQAKIGKLFNKLDETIILQQQLLNDRKRLKKAMLQKMFPQKGETVPKVRFAGYTDDWKHRKLKDILKVNSGKDYKHLSTGDIPVYGTGGYMLSVDEKLSDIDGVGIGRKGTIDKPKYLKAPFWTVDTLFYITVLVENDLDFFFSMSQTINWKRMDESTGVPSLSKKVIEEVTQVFPSLKEQTKIGKFFKKLDETIDLHEKKLETYQELKKAMLQKMFV